jgi:hypothetical protein
MCDAAKTEPVETANTEATSIDSNLLIFYLLVDGFKVPALSVAPHSIVPFKAVDGDNAGQALRL